MKKKFEVRPEFSNPWIQSKRWRIIMIEMIKTYITYITLKENQYIAGNDTQLEQNLKKG